MRKLFFLMTCIMLVINFILFQPTLYAKVVDQIIAYVNDDIITKYELNRVVEERALELQQIYQFNPKEAKRKAQKERPGLLDKMIRKMLLVQEALKRNIKITDAEVEQYINDLKKRAGIKSSEEFRKQLEAEGHTRISFREQTKKDLMAERLTLLTILPKINITESEITEFFNENSEKFTSKSDSVKLSHIFVEFSDNQASLNQKAGTEHPKETHQKIKKILEQLDSGMNFGDLAQKYSDDFQEKKPGFKPVAELQPDFRDEILSLKEGEYTKPIETERGIYIFKLEAREIPELTKQEREQIRNRLREVKFQKEWEKFTDRLKKKAFIKTKETL